MASSPTRLPAPEITRRLRARFGDALLDAAEPTDQAVVRIGADRYRELVTTLRDDAELAFDYPDFVSAVDRGEEGLEVVTQLYSTRHHHTVRVKVPCEKGENGDGLSCPSISDLYPGANWHERETWELFGIRFEGHPSLVKLLLPEQFEGHPLRKDFPLTTRVAKPWPGAEEGEAIEEVDT